MGAKVSSLPPEDVAELAKETKLTPNQVRRLYERFTRLDKDNSGSLSPEEFLAVPEFAMNPLAERILSVFQAEQELGQEGHSLRGERNKREPMGMKRRVRPLNLNVEVDFRTFVKTLAVFFPNRSHEEKLKFAFDVYNLSGDGFLKPQELFQVLRLMVGDHLDDKDLQHIVDKTIEESDVIDHDGNISFAEFSKILENRDITEKMTIAL